MSTLDTLLEKAALYNVEFPRDEVIARGGMHVKTDRFQPAVSSIFGLKITETWSMGEWVLTYEYGEDGATLKAKQAGKETK